MNSFSYALDKLHKFNRAVGTNSILADLFITKDFNFLQAFQTAILFDFKYFYEKNRLKEDTAQFELREFEIPSSWPQHLLALAVTCWAVLKLLLARPKVIVFSVDKVNSKYKSDFRIEGLYDFLHQNNIRYAEIIHTIIGGHFKKFLFQRKRSVIYLESVDSLFKLLAKVGIIIIHSSKIIKQIDLTSFGDDGEIVKSMLLKYLIRIRQSQFRIRTLSGLLSLSSIQTLLTIDDTRDYHELLAACHANKMNTYAFQHGAFSKYTVGWLYCGYGRESIVKPNKLFLWGRYWLDELKRLGTYFDDAQLGFAGNPKNFRAVTFPITTTIPDKIITILMPYEIEAPKREVAKFVYEILKCPSLEFIFKTRSDASNKSQLVEYEFKEVMPSNFMMMSSIPDDLMAKIDIVVGTHSTFLYEMLAYLKPIYILKTDLDYSEGMVINGLADWLDPKELTSEGVYAFNKISKETLLVRREKFYRDFGSLEKTLNQICLSQKL